METLQQGKRNFMLHDCACHKKWKFAALDQAGKQESVFATQSKRVKESLFDLHVGASNGEASGIQVSNATIGLEQVFLEAHEPQFFGSADEAGIVADKAELKIVLLWRGGDRRFQGRETICLESAICVREENG
jgi:hypothetical protein